jgi:predicted ester cyclase
MKGLCAAYLAAFDTHVTSEILIAEGDLVAVHDTNWLKHTGEHHGHPPTGKELQVTSTDIYRLAGGRIVEQWFEADLTGIERQLGLLSASAHGAGLSLG